MKEIWVVSIGEEYSHSDNDSAFADKDKALLRAMELAAEKKIPLVRDCYWYDGLYFIQVLPLHYSE